MKKCSKCDKIATSDNGLCNSHFAQWVASDDDEVDPQEIIEELVGRFGPDYEWFCDWFDVKFKYKGKDRLKVYYEAFLEIRNLIENAYDLGTLDGPDDDMDDDDFDRPETEGNADMGTDD